MEEVLEESMGLMIYQEHVNLVAMALSDLHLRKETSLEKYWEKNIKKRKSRILKTGFLVEQRKMG